MTDVTGNRQRLADRIRSTHPCQYALNLAFGDLVVRVETNTRALMLALRDYFGPFVTDRHFADITVSAHQAQPPELPCEFTVKQPDPGKTKLKEEFADLEDGRVLRKITTGMVFVYGENDHLAVGPCLENANQVINFIDALHIQHMLKKGCLLGHAAGVASHGRGLCMAGFSGAGKSTLALHVMSLGASFVSNDRVMIESAEQGLVMHGVAKLPRINPGTALNNPNLVGILEEQDVQRYRSMAPADLWSLEEKYDVFIDQCFGPGRFQITAPMDALVILSWKLADEPCRIRTVDPAERPELLEAIRKSAGLFYLPGESDPAPLRPVEDYVQVLSRCTVIEMAGGVDFDKAA
ncbi:MAG: HprK-related kinase B, partial [Desulfovibrionaceae bacterium]